ncbi:tRNA lysidine(34) synthetase TilS [Clostridiaceae bacterium]|nr:tRNA lysidine(34) synthetase TilS [Clostridiaceae bacterium]
MWKKVWDFVEKHHMLRQGDRVVVGVSGGADSVCLLAVLAKNQLDLKLRAVHVHHGLRGKEADNDAEFVRDLCGKWGIPFKLVYRNVAEYGKEHGLSVEEAGRVLRYEALEEVANEWEDHEGEKVWIGVAHHQDDNAETILHHLFRGSGLRGLSGMRAVQGNRIRPLLIVGRQEILEYLTDRNLTWREDSTNQSEHYTRNRIRHCLIPYMTEQINHRAVENVLHAGEIFARADQYLEKQAGLVWDKYGWENREQLVMAGIQLKGFLRQDPIIQDYLVRKMLEAAASGQKDITAKHVRQIEGLAEGGPGGSCDLPGNLRVVRTYESLYVEAYGKKDQKVDKEIRENGEIVVLPDPGEEAVWVGKMGFRAFFRENGTEIPKKEYTKWFDYDKIKDTLCIRRRLAGDYLVLSGGGRKPLRRFLIDEKVPREQRDQIVVLAEGNRILWVVGYRISEYYKIREDTHTILQVDFYGGNAYGGKDSGIIVRRRSRSENL